MSNQSPQSKRGDSSSTPKHGATLKTTGTTPKEQRPGEDDAIFKANKAYVKKMNS